MRIGVGIKRKQGETWRDVAYRYAKAHGLEKEVLDIYDQEVLAGIDPADAALHACYEWDVAVGMWELDHEPNGAECAEVPLNPDDGA